jgi:ribosomal-protein-alanine N-acetyltransferase
LLLFAVKEMGSIEGLTIRTFRDEDLDRVVYINRTCLPENYGTYFFLEIHENYPKTFLVAEVDGRVVGYIMCRTEYGSSNFKRLSIVKKGHVISIAVLPEYRRRGIGTALLTHCLKNLEEYGAKECFLEVRVSNEVAKSLYSKLGFKSVGKIGGYYFDGEDALIMSVKLPLEMQARTPSESQR